MTDDAGTDDAAADELPPEVGVDFDPTETDAEFPDDERRRRVLRTIAEEVRADSSESRQLSAILYRVSDLYDSDEDTSPEEIYLNVRNIVQVKAQGGLDR